MVLVSVFILKSLLKDYITKFKHTKVVALADCLIQGHRSEPGLQAWNFNLSLRIVVQVTAC